MSMQPIRDFDEELQLVPLGNLLAQDAMEILNENQPYPGDPETPPDGCDYHDRFLLYQISDTHHIVMDYWKFKEWTKDGRDYAYIPNSVIEDGRVAKFYHDVCLSRSTNAREWPKEKQNQIKHPVNRLEFQLQHTMNAILDPNFWSEVKRPL
jgi:hypothetical protein